MHSSWTLISSFVLHSSLLTVVTTNSSIEPSATGYMVIKLSSNQDPFSSNQGIFCQSNLVADDSIGSGYSLTVKHINLAVADGD